MKHEHLTTEDYCTTQVVVMDNNNPGSGTKHPIYLGLENLDTHSLECIGLTLEEAVEIAKVLMDLVVRHRLTPPR